MVAANDAGYFKAEMAPIEVKTKKGKESMQKDEHPKPQTTMEQLTKLPCVFKKDGTVTAGNASVSTSDPWVGHVSPLVLQIYGHCFYLSPSWLSVVSPDKNDF